MPVMVADDGKEVHLGSATRNQCALLDVLAVEIADGDSEAGISGGSQRLKFEIGVRRIGPVQHVPQGQDEGGRLRDEAIGDTLRCLADHRGRALTARAVVSLLRRKSHRRARKPGTG